jgi:LPXTG-motif cell wall-anchored protein
VRVTHRRWLTAAVAATGAGALALGAAALPAVGLESKPAEPGPDGLTTANSFVEPNSTGPEALSQMDSSDLQTVAARAGMTANKLSSLLEADAAIVTPDGYVAFVDDFNINDHALDFDAEAAADVPGDPVGGSRPDAPITIFLDFGGHTIQNTQWNRAYEVDTIEVPAYNVDDDFKYAVWEGVAQDYAPFNVNVTISDPGADALYRTSPDDANYGAHLVMVPDESVLPGGLHGAGGWAMIGGFGNEHLAPALTIAENVSHNPKFIADVSSHEVGHTLGLHHHGMPGQEYYVPSSGLWGPIMGGPYRVPLGTWSDGGYPGASNPDQDDLAMIVDPSNKLDSVVLYLNGEFWPGMWCTDGDPNNPQPGDMFVVYDEATSTCTDQLLDAEFTYGGAIEYVSDPHGDSTGDATALDNSEGSFEAEGTVVTEADVDVFSLVTAGGSFSAEAAPMGSASNLDIKLSLLDADGNVIAENEQETTVGGSQDNRAAEGLEASIAEELEMGVYYLQVEGRGQGNPADNTPENGAGYTDYASLGFYQLTGDAEPLDVAPITITSPEDGAEVEPAGLEVTGTAEAEATVTLSVDGETVGSAEADAEGAWSTTLEDDLAPGETTITARQTIDTITVPQTASVTVTVLGDDPGYEDGTEDGTEDGDDNGTEDGTEEGGDNGTEGGTEEGGDNGTEEGDDNGTDNGDDNGDEELPDTGAGNLIGLAAGLGLLAVGGVLYARTRRAMV